MKKLTILSVPFLTAFLVFLFLNLNSQAQSDRKLKSKIIGTWQICNLQTGLPDTTYDGKANQVRYKYIVPGKFNVVDIEYKEKRLHGAFNGAYIIEKGTYTEFLENTGNGYQYLLASRNTFIIRITNDTLYISGTNNRYYERWRRVK